MAATGLTAAEVLETLDASRSYTAASLDAPLDDDTTTYERLGVSDPAYEQVDRRMVTLRGLRTLRTRERRIIVMRFYEGLTQTEIAERMGISQMHVSRLLRAALDDLRPLIPPEHGAVDDVG